MDEKKNSKPASPVELAVQEAFQKCLDLPAPARNAFLDELGKKSPLLRAEVQLLLRNHDAFTSLLGDKKKEPATPKPASRKKAIAAKAPATPPHRLARGLLILSVVLLVPLGIGFWGWWRLKHQPHQSHRIAMHPVSTLCREERKKFCEGWKQPKQVILCLKLQEKQLASDCRQVFKQMAGLDECIGVARTTCPHDKIGEATQKCLERLEDQKNGCSAYFSITLPAQLVGWKSGS